MSKDKKLSITDFTNQELELELKRRSIPKEKLWYFFEDKDAEDCPVFVICSIRFFELRGYVHDRYISNYLGLPNSFQEIMRSHFSFSGKKKDGKRILESMGFVELKYRHKNHLEHVARTASQSRIFNYCCHSKKVLKIALKRLLLDPNVLDKSTLIFSNFSDYNKWMTETLGPDLIIHQDYLDNHVSIIENSEFNALPPYPF